MVDSGLLHDSMREGAIVNVAWDDLSTFPIAPRFVRTFAAIRQLLVPVAL
jgi:hypothetical protein